MSEFVRGLKCRLCNKAYPKQALNFCTEDFGPLEVDYDYDAIAEAVNRLKAQPGKDLSVGGAGIASAFIRLGLIDEYCLYVHPIVLGSGKPMFQQVRDRLNLKLVETQAFGSRVVLLKYRPADEHHEGRAA